MKLVAPSVPACSDFYLPVVIECDRCYMAIRRAPSDVEYFSILYAMEPRIRFSAYLLPLHAAVLYAAQRIVDPGVVEQVDGKIAELADAVEPLAKLWLALAPVFEPIPPGRYEVAPFAVLLPRNYVFGVGDIRIVDDYVEVREGDGYVVYPIAYTALSLRRGVAAFLSDSVVAALPCVGRLPDGIPRFCAAFEAYRALLE